MATRVTDGATRERLFFFSGSRPRFARLAASPLARTCTPLTKSEEKETLLTVYNVGRSEILMGNSFIARCYVTSK